MIIDLSNLNIVNFTVKRVDLVWLIFLLFAVIIAFLLSLIIKPEDIFELIRIAIGLDPLPTTLRRSHVLS